MLKKITLNNFCGFREYTVEFSDFTLLVGPNNGGKTTILKAINFCLQASRNTFIRNDIAQEGIFKKVKPGCDLVTTANFLSVNDVNELYFGKDRAALAEVTLYFDGKLNLQIKAQCQQQSNNIFVFIELDDIPHTDLSPEQVKIVCKELERLSAIFIPPPASINPIENEMSMTELQNLSNKGKYSEVWRNQLHWDLERIQETEFSRIVSRVSNYIGDVKIHRPRRSHGNPPTVEIIYEQDGVEYDISAAGSGVRTLFTLAAAIENTQAPIFLFDEPDSHLHSLIQRQVAEFMYDSASPSKQLIVSSHAPDFIEEIPIESIVWVDRKNTQGKKCDEIGRTLVDLGAVSHTQAMSLFKANAIVYTEGKIDKKGINIIAAKCNKKDIFKETIFANLHGFGDADKLPGVLRVFRNLRDLDIQMAAILDADYISTKPEGTFDLDGDVLMIRLPCKEIENLLLMSPKCIYRALKIKKAKYKEYTNKSVSIPNEEAIRSKISEISKADKYLKIIKPQWLTSWGKENNRKFINPSDFIDADKEFLKMWQDIDWRIRCCPGKEVLKELRNWLQLNCSLTITTEYLFNFYEPSDDVIRLLSELEKHILMQPP